MRHQSLLLHSYKEAMEAAGMRKIILYTYYPTATNIKKNGSKITHMKNVSAPPKKQNRSSLKSIFCIHHLYITRLYNQMDHLGQQFEAHRCLDHRTAHQKEMP